MTDTAAVSYYRRVPEHSRYAFGNPMYYVPGDRTSLINAYHRHYTETKRQPSFVITWSDKVTDDAPLPKEPEAFNNTTGYVCIPDPVARIWQLHPRELLNRQYLGRVAPS